jgi:hypothetical protein
MFSLPHVGGSRHPAGRRGAPAPLVRPGGWSSTTEVLNMHDSNTSTRPLLGSSIVITVHAETIGVVRTVDLSNGDDQLVSLQVGDDRSGVRLLGDIAVVRHLVAQAGVELSQLAHGEGGR